MRGRRILVILVLMITTSAAAQQAKTAPRKNPVPYSRKSIAAGKDAYLRNCTDCHDADGRSLSGRDFTATPPTDLTDPESWKNGTTEEQVFTSIREGTKKDMPPYKGKLQDEQIWHVVNFVRSLWPEAQRPKLADP